VPGLGPGTSLHKLSIPTPAQNFHCPCRNHIERLWFMGASFPRS
jgi:hypothetical protein